MLSEYLDGGRTEGKAYICEVKGLGGRRRRKRKRRNIEEESEGEWDCGICWFCCWIVRRVGG